MSPFQNTVKALTDAMCKICSGLGVCDDAEAGDMYYNHWPCIDCNATGFKDVLILTRAPQPPLKRLARKEEGK